MKPSNVAVRRERREERYNVNYKSSQKYSSCLCSLVTDLSLRKNLEHTTLEEVREGEGDE